MSKSSKPTNAVVDDTIDDDDDEAAYDAAILSLSAIAIEALSLK